MKIVFILILFIMSLFGCQTIKNPNKVLLNNSSLIDDDISAYSSRYIFKGESTEEVIFNKYNIKDNYMFVQMTCSRMSYPYDNDGELIFGDCPKLEYLLIFENDSIDQSFKVKVYENNNYKKYLEKYLGEFDVNYSKLTKQFLDVFFTSKIKNKATRNLIDNEYRIKINYKGNKYSNTFQENSMQALDTLWLDRFNNNMNYQQAKNNIFWFLEQINSELLTLDYLSVESK